jgi:hypothetical protein
MARIRGEFAFEADGRSYTLVYSVNALIALEEALGCPMPEFAARFGAKQIGLKEFRAAFRAGLTDHHPDVDDLAAGRIMDALGVDRTAALVAEAFGAAFPVEPQGAADSRENSRPLPGLPAGRAGLTSSGRGASSGSNRRGSGATPRP